MKPFATRELLARLRQQRHTSSEPGGTRLGQAIAQWIASAHHGAIRVESQIGTGTLFEVRLPLTNVATMIDANVREIK